MYLPGPGRPVSNASEDSGAPVIPLSQTPVTMITSAVIEHMMMVSINVPSMAIMPWRTGSWVRAAACGALAAVVVRWLAPFLILRWLKVYATGFSCED